MRSTIIILLFMIAPAIVSAEQTDLSGASIKKTLDEAKRQTGKITIAPTGKPEDIPTKEQVRDDIERAKEMAHSIKTPPLENIKPAKPNIDVGQLAGKYDTAKQALARPDRSLLVFVTLSMPSETLVRIGRDVKKVNGRMVLRGFTNNSMKETIKQLQPIQQATGGTEIDIDPRAYSFYGITQVPAYVLETGAGYAVRVGGDVSLSYALEQMTREPRIAHAARTYLGALSAEDN